MPRIIDYPEVLRRLTCDEGLVSLYHNGGAFGFSRETPTHTVGWIGPPDPTIRPAALEFAQTIPPPHAPNLASLLIRAWREHLAPAEAWVVPMSHWSFELDFASHTWLPDVLREIGVDPAALQPLNNAAAIAFTNEEGETTALDRLARALLENLKASDFAIAFPGRPVVCTLHHHRQLWWVTSEEPLAISLRDLVRP
jgi:hypothetical protein